MASYYAASLAASVTRPVASWVPCLFFVLIVVCAGCARGSVGSPPSRMVEWLERGAISCEGNPRSYVRRRLDAADRSSFLIQSELRKLPLLWDFSGFVPSRFMGPVYISPSTRPTQFRREETARFAHQIPRK